MKNYNEIFSDSTVLITGGARRLGRAIALDIATYGAHILLHYNHSDEQAQDTLEKIEELGGKCTLLKADLSIADQAQGLILRAVEKVGPVDFLINNASVFPQNGVNDLSFSDLEGNFKVNTYAPLLLCREFACQKRKGAIINMLDTRIHSYDREHVAYHLSKQALYSLTRMLAWEYAPHVRVNGIAPGIILPPPGEGMEWLDKMRHTNPLDSYGSVEDIADAVLFLLASEFITGDIIHVDGGRHLKNRFY